MSGNPPPRSGLIRSFGFAFAGIATLLRTQRNARIHACATMAVVAAGFYFHVTPMEWCLLALAITGVWVAEAFNTALEFLADAVSPDINPLVKKSEGHRRRGRADSCHRVGRGRYAGVWHASVHNRQIDIYKLYSTISRYVSGTASQPLCPCPFTRIHSQTASVPRGGGGFASLAPR
jgi:diacylglycerol kinase